MRLARPFESITEYEITTPNTDTVIKIYEQASKGKLFGALHDLMIGCVRFNGETPSSALVRKMPVVSAEVAAIEIFREAGYDTKVENVYHCVRCGHKIIHELTKDEDTRDDISSLRINYAKDDAPYKLDLAPGKEVVITASNKGDEVATISGYTIRDALLGDMISAQNDASLKDSLRVAKKINLACLVDGDCLISDINIESFEQLKTRYSYELLNFPDIRDFNKIQKLQRTYGIDPTIEFSCPECGKEQTGRVEFTDFFVSVLRQTLSGAN